MRSIAVAVLFLVLQATLATDFPAFSADQETFCYQRDGWEAALVRMRQAEIAKHNALRGLHQAPPLT